MRREYRQWVIPQKQAIALESVTILDWALGILPWTFRRPILCILSDHLRDNSDLEPLHRAARDALNFTRFNIRHPAKSKDAIRLVEFCCDYSGPPQTPDSILAQSDLFHTFENDSPDLEEYYFRYRVLLKVCKNFIALIPNGTPKGSSQRILGILINAFLDHRLSIPLKKARQYDLDTHSIGSRAFLFWRWQYVQRNTAYRALQKRASEILDDNLIRHKIAQLDLLEVIMVPPLHPPTESPSAADLLPHRRSENVAELKQLNEESRNRFNMLVAWPLEDYDSGVILGRILSGEFAYWERPTPPSFLLDRPPNVSSKNRERFEAIWTEFQQLYGNFFSPINQDANSTPLATAAHYDSLRKFDNLYSHEIVTRIRPEAEHRAIGLWLWDHVNNHGGSGAEAAKALVSTHPDLEKYENAQFDRDLRTAREAISQAEYVKTVNARPKKRGRPAKKSRGQSRRKP